MFFFENILRESINIVAKNIAKISPIQKKFCIKERLCGPWPKGPLLWFHGASLGECKMLLNLAEFIRLDIASCPKILITTQKSEVIPFLNKIIKEQNKKGIYISIAPLDTPSSLNHFFSVVKPLGLVLGENELWKGYLSSMRAFSIKPSVALVSGRIYKTDPFLDYQSIGFASMQTGGNLSRLNNKTKVISKTLIGGDWKLLSWARNGNDIIPPLNPSIDVVFLSVHFSEWKSLVYMLKKTATKKEISVIIPRKISEVKFFKEALREQEITTTEWPLIKKGCVSIVSSFGKTKDVLKSSKLAVVGGSFNSHLGIHNFWEPLLNGVPTYIGPFFYGQKETIYALLRDGIITQLQSPKDFPSKTNPDIQHIRNFLLKERIKISNSYLQLLIFLKDILKTQGYLQ